MPPKKKARRVKLGITGTEKGQMLGYDDAEVAAFGAVIGVAKDGDRRVWNGKQWRPACAERGCPKRATQAGDDGVLMYCGGHKKAGMTNANSKQCSAEGCTKRPSYGLLDAAKGKVIATVCAKHKTGDMEEPFKKTCTVDGCEVTASFGVDNARTHCAEHKTDDMACFTVSLCNHDGCEKYANYGNKEEGRQWCAEHKKDGDISLTACYCETPECEIMASFGFEGGKLQFCKKHKEDDMICLASTLCPHEGCRTQGSFGVDGQAPYYCAEHKSGDMVPRKISQCEDDTCTMFGIYGYASDNKRRRCLAHVLEDMEMLAKRRCDEEGCKKQPSFGLEGDGLVNKCADHKTSEMINLTRKRCDEDDCEKELWAVDQEKCYLHGGGFPCASPNDCSGRVALAKSWCGDCQLTGSSRMERKCMELIAEKYDIDDMIAGDAQFRIPTTMCKADGYSATHKIVFEYHGVFFHGFRNNFNAEGIGYGGETNSTLYERTVARMKRIKDLGYRVVHVWGPSIKDTDTIDVLDEEVFEFVEGECDTFLPFKLVSDYIV